MQRLHEQWNDKRRWCNNSVDKRDSFRRRRRRRSCSRSIRKLIYGRNNHHHRRHKRQQQRHRRNRSKYIIQLYNAPDLAAGRSPKLHKLANLHIEDYHSRFQQFAKLGKHHSHPAAIGQFGNRIGNIADGNQRSRKLNGPDTNNIPDARLLLYQCQHLGHIQLHIVEYEQCCLYDYMRI